MNKIQSILALICLSLALSVSAQAKQTTTLTLVMTAQHFEPAQQWSQVKAAGIQSKLNDLVGSDYPGFRGTADIEMATKVKNDSYWMPTGGGDSIWISRYTGLITLRMNSFAYAFDQQTEKFPGMTCDEAEVEGRRLHPRAFFSEFETYKEGSIFHRVHGCAFTSYSIVPVTN